MKFIEQGPLKTHSTKLAILQQKKMRCDSPIIANADKESDIEKKTFSDNFLT
jgi:hypothetical protein